MTWVKLAPPVLEGRGNGPKRPLASRREGERKGFWVESANGRGERARGMLKFKGLRSRLGNRKGVAGVEGSSNKDAGGERGGHQSGNSGGEACEMAAGPGHVGGEGSAPEDVGRPYVFGCFDCNGKCGLPIWRRRMAELQELDDASLAEEATEMGVQGNGRDELISNLAAMEELGQVLLSLASIMPYHPC